ncbi:MAG: hypothetical protein PUE12_05575 [Oscillospiraceae bacterium]|nr:hypothetical protein [Oscillospiraceae bacterium]
MKGYLRIHVHTASGLFPVKNAIVEIYRLSGSKPVKIISVLTDENGCTKNIPLEVGTGLYEVYCVDTMAEGFVKKEKSEMNVYANTASVHSVEIILEEAA